MSAHEEERGQALVVVLALVGLVAAVAYGYLALAGSVNQQSTLRSTDLAEYRASDSGAEYAMWYAENKGFPPAGALTAPDPGDGLGAPAVTLADLRPALSFGPVHSKANPQTYDSPAHALVGSGDVFVTFTWTSSATGRGRLNLRFDTTPVQPPGFTAQATITMPAGATSTTSSVTFPTSGPGTFYLHIQNTTNGADMTVSSAGTFLMNYPGMVFQATSVRNGRTTALDAGLTRSGGVYSATVNAWTLR